MSSAGCRSKSQLMDSITRAGAQFPHEPARCASGVGCERLRHGGEHRRVATRGPLAQPPAPVVWADVYTPPLAPLSVWPGELRGDFAIGASDEQPCPIFVYILRTDPERTSDRNLYTNFGQGQRTLGGAPVINVQETEPSRIGGAHAAVSNQLRKSSLTASQYVVTSQVLSQRVAEFDFRCFGLAPGRPAAVSRRNHPQFQ